MTQKHNDPVTEKRDPLLSLPVIVARIKSLGEVVKAKADADQCAELCRRLGILSVKSFAIDARVTPFKKTGARMEGRVMGEVEQACVVTLKPVLQVIDEPFSLTLVPEGSPFARKSNDELSGGEMIIDPEGEDPPEAFEGEVIDVGAYAEEFFALALDDYPRADDADFHDHIEDKGGPDSADNPFAALAGLKDQLSTDGEN
ncbi:YceD family protein [Cohaesibacter intestini]|uniref:YceD family protein n=1 Tax=Cohaesibacter intestini TaxID=2211145 RepID=UPI0013003AC6|nr:DUF177 domain-containing protein [Cohaesibacter intestini]